MSKQTIAENLIQMLEANIDSYRAGCYTSYEFVCRILWEAVKAFGQINEQ